MKDRCLYITDLDGTLLNSEKTLNQYALETINGLIEKGLYFSIATARTAASAVKILEGLKINAPAVLMNGAAVYDLQQHRYLKTEEIPNAAVLEIISAMRSHGVTGFMYGISDDKLSTYYENLESEPMRAFYDERVRKYYKSFVQVEDFTKHTEEKSIVYFCLLDGKEKLNGIYGSFKGIKGIEAVMYRDIYEENLWYLEVYSETASKYNATRFIQETCGFERIIGFGDNFNDIPLLKACDEFYAVANAVEELKSMASGVIGDNHSGGVVRFIAEREGWNG